ncbi:hypothetical protein DSECCO2_489950 [anaerobic digester metagenome]
MEQLLADQAIVSKEQNDGERQGEGRRDDRHGGQGGHQFLLPEACSFDEEGEHVSHQGRDGSGEDAQS